MVQRGRGCMRCSIRTGEVCRQCCLFWERFHERELSTTFSCTNGWQVSLKPIPRLDSNMLLIEMLAWMEPWVLARTMSRSSDSHFAFLNLLHQRVQSHWIISILSSHSCRNYSHALALEGACMRVELTLSHFMSLWYQKMRRLREPTIPTVITVCAWVVLALRAVDKYRRRHWDKFMVLWHIKRTLLRWWNFLAANAYLAGLQPLPFRAGAVHQNSRCKLCKELAQIFHAR
jgi:hypothetical protein